jgi:predicted transcriptional regulator
MTTRVVTAHIPEALARQVDKLAERLERPRGWVVKQALTAWVATEEERHRMTLEALADVDAGHVVDHGEIEEWASALKAPKKKRR